MGRPHIIVSKNPKELNQSLETFANVLEEFSKIKMNKSKTSIIITPQPKNENDSKNVKNYY